MLYIYFCVFFFFCIWIPNVRKTNNAPPRTPTEYKHTYTAGEHQRQTHWVTSQFSSFQLIYSTSMPLPDPYNNALKADFFSFDFRYSAQTSLQAQKPVKRNSMHAGCDCDIIYWFAEMCNGFIEMVWRTCSEDVLIVYAHIEASFGMVYGALHNVQQNGRMRRINSKIGLYLFSFVRCCCVRIMHGRVSFHGIGHQFSDFIFFRLSASPTKLQPTQTRCERISFGFVTVHAATFNRRITIRIADDLGYPFCIRIGNVCQHHTHTHSQWNIKWIL